MEKVPKLSCRYRTIYNDVDFTGRMKLSALFYYFQEAAGLHAENLGIGINTIMKRHGVAWVLLRMLAEVERYPVQDEEFVVETWPQTPRKLEFERDYIMRDLEGKILCRGRSVWCIIDLEKRQIKKTETIKTDYPPFITDRAIDCGMEKLRALGSPSPAYKRRIGPSDLDFNRHINNSKYMDFIMDCFSLEELEKYEARSVQVNYLAEAFAGDTISLFTENAPHDKTKVYIEGINDSRGDPVFRAAITVKA